MTTEAQKRASAKWRKKNREKLRVNQAEWAAANKDKIKSKSDAYRANPEVRKRQAEYTKKWIAEHPEAHKKHSLAYYHRTKHLKS